MPNLNRRHFIGGRVYPVGESSIVDLRPADAVAPWRHVWVTGNHVVSQEQRVILADAATRSIAVSLPNAFGQTHPVTVRKTDDTANTVTLVPLRGQTVDGGTSIILTRQSSHTLVSDGQNWYTYSAEGADTGGTSPPWDAFVRRDGTTTMLADWPVGYRHFSQVGVIDVQPTAPIPVLGSGWLKIPG